MSKKSNGSNQQKKANRYGRKNVQEVAVYKNQIIRLEPNSEDTIYIENENLVGSDVQENNIQDIQKYLKRNNPVIRTPIGIRIQNSLCKNAVHTIISGVLIVIISACISWVPTNINRLNIEMLEHGIKITNIEKKCDDISKNMITKEVFDLKFEFLKK